MDYSTLCFLGARNLGVTFFVSLVGDYRWYRSLFSTAFFVGRLHTDTGAI